MAVALREATYIYNTTINIDYSKSDLVGVRLGFFYIVCKAVL